MNLDSLFISDFKRIVLEDLNTLSMKMNALIDSCANITKTLRLMTENRQYDITFDKDDYPLLRQLLPLKTENDMKQLEVLLTKKNNHQALVSIYLQEY